MPSDHMNDAEGQQIVLPLVVEEGPGDVSCTEKRR